MGRKDQIIKSLVGYNPVRPFRPESSVISLRFGQIRPELGLSGRRPTDRVPGRGLSLGWTETVE
jgi:hypothetical protein